jgi:hypothetical protein
MRIALVLIALMLFIGIAFAVKMFDSEIRASKYGKLIVDILFFVAIILIVVAIVNSIGGN